MHNEVKKILRYTHICRKSNRDDASSNGGKVYMTYQWFHLFFFYESKMLLMITWNRSVFIFFRYNTIFFVTVLQASSTFYKLQASNLL